MGKIEKNIVRQSLRFDRSIPDKIVNSPKLNQGLQLYLEAFFELITERSVGMEVGYIPRSVIIEYARFYEFDDEQTYCLLYIIQYMDREYVNFQKKS